MEKYVEFRSTFLLSYIPGQLSWQASKSTTQHTTQGKVPSKSVCGGTENCHGADHGRNYHQTGLTLLILSNGMNHRVSLHKDMPTQDTTFSSKKKY